MTAKKKESDNDTKVWVQLSIVPSDKEKIERAAALEGLSPNEFVNRSLARATHRGLAAADDPATPYEEIALQFARIYGWVITDSYFDRERHRLHFRDESGTYRTLDVTSNGSGASAQIITHSTLPVEIVDAWYRNA